MEFKESYFVKNLKLIKKSPKNIFHIILFDILFIAVLGIFTRLVEFFFLESPLETSAVTITIYLILTLLYYLALVFVCSFFKYLILNSIKSLFKKTELSFVNLKKFYLLNLLIFIVFFMAFLILNSVFLLGAKQEYAPYIFLIVNLPLILITYIFMNISHTLFSESEKPIIKEITKKTFDAITKIKSYIGIFLTNIIAIIIYFTLFYFIGLILKNTLFKGYLASVKYYNIYTIIFSVITTAFFYFIIFFNRIYFYNIIKNAVLRKK